MAASRRGVRRGGASGGRIDRREALERRGSRGDSPKPSGGDLSGGLRGSHGREAAGGSDQRVGNRHSAAWPRGAARRDGASRTRVPGEGRGCVGARGDARAIRIHARRRPADPDRARCGVRVPSRDRTLVATWPRSHAMVCARSGALDPLARRPPCRRSRPRRRSPRRTRACRGARLFRGDRMEASDGGGRRPRRRADSGDRVAARGRRRDRRDAGVVRRAPREARGDRFRVEAA